MNLTDKDISIVSVVESIISVWGEGFFETYISDKEEKLVDFWEADLCAIGLKRGQKVIYISSWDFRFRALEEMMYYIEFELIEEGSLETKEVVKQISGVSREDLLLYIKEFMS